MLTTFPDVVVPTDLAHVNSFEEPVVLMTGAAFEAADQVEDIFIVNSFSLEFIDKLLFGNSATEEATKGAF